MLAAGRVRPVAGRVCMDQFVLDLGEDAARAGDQVVLFGDGAAGEPTAQDWADACGTISYEIVTRSARAFRVRMSARRSSAGEPTALGRPGRRYGRRRAGRSGGRRRRWVRGRAYVVGRSLRRDDPYADESWGRFAVSRERWRPPTSLLHVEVDGDTNTSPLTVVFTHGCALNQDSWHFQRRDLAGRARLVSGTSARTGVRVALRKAA